MIVQTRSETNGIKEFPTLREAFEAAEKDPSIWKISFAEGDERIRLINLNGNGWKYAPLLREVHELETIEAERFYNLGFEIDPQKE